MSETRTRVRFNAQTPGEKVTTESLEEAGRAWSRMIVDNVAVRIGENAKYGLRAELAKSISIEVREVIDQMAKRISRGMKAPPNARAPQARLSVAGVLSRYGRLNGWNAPFYTSNTNPPIKWKPLSPKYVKYKKQKYNTDRWWEKTGELTEYLSNPDVYYEAFGPLAVQFLPSRKDKQRVKGSGTEFIARTRGNNWRREVKIGRVEVIVFGDITDSILPALRTQNPADIGPDADFVGPHIGLAGMIANKNLEQGEKLFRYGRKVIDPFVSFYLTRAIPDTVLRRTSERIEGAIRG